MKRQESFSSPAVDGGAVASEALENLLGAFVPDEGLGILVPRLDPAQDVGGQFLHVAMGRVLQLLSGEGGEPALPSSSKSRRSA
jgi:hypothetical protein